jgi:C1A family cysteine protease
MNFLNKLATTASTKTSIILFIEISFTFNESALVRKFVYDRLVEKYDLTQWCSSIRDQGKLDSSSAHANIAMIEFLYKKRFGKYIPMSPMFSYKAMTNLALRSTEPHGDIGGSPSAGVAVGRLFGALPEEFWPYTQENFDKEPSAFCYALAQNFKSYDYLRLDYGGVSKSSLLSSIKVAIADGLPVTFGFAMYDSIDQSATEGKIPCPCQGEKIRRGHAVMAIGYDDKMKIRNLNCEEVTEGAIHILNSWGVNWGDKGYGWLPYKYFLLGMAEDCWALYGMESYIDLEEFGL